MKNHIQLGDTLTIPAPETVLSGGVVIAGEIVGIAAGHAASGALVDVQTSGVFELPKVAADAIALGAPIYWDAEAELATVTDTDTDTTRLGVAVAAAPASTATVRVRLSGF